MPTTFGGRGSSSSSTPGAASRLFLGLDDEPVKSDWEAHKGKWTGRVIAPIDRANIGGHGSIARFATINNDSATTGFGYEQLSRTTVYANMRASFGTGVNIYWEWRIGQDVEIGDLAYRLSGGTNIYSIAVRAHTTTAGDVADGAPNEANQTGWVTHSIAEVVNHANFAGIVGSLADVDTSALSHGEWVASIVDDFMDLWVWTTTHNEWLSYFPGGIGSLHQNGYLNEAEAAHQVRAFTSGSPDYYLIDGQLKILTFYVAPTAGDEIFFANPVRYSDPTSVLWGPGQSKRFDSAMTANRAHVSLEGGNLYLKWQHGPGDNFFGASDDIIDILSAADAGTLATGADNLPSAANRGLIYLRPIPGVWTFHGHVSTNKDLNSDYPQVKMLRVTPAAKDDETEGIGQRTGFSANAGGVGTLSGLFHTLEFNFSLVRVSLGSLLYFVLGDQILSGDNVDTSQHVECIFHGSA